MLNDCILYLLCPIFLICSIFMAKITQKLNTCISACMNRPKSEVFETVQ